MSWLQLQLLTDQNNAQALEALLEQAGALSVTMVDAEDQPLFEPGPGEILLWNSIRLTGLFSGDTDYTELMANLTQLHHPLELPEIKVSTLDDQSWERAWMQDFKPMLFGKRLWVCPTWATVEEPDAVCMKLDPGLAFGTGTHPTTALCLEWLDAQNLSGLTLIDYGCGSGILGIAALLLGAEKVYGVDNDPQAITATADNCDKNALSTELFPCLLPKAFAQKISSEEIVAADIVVANILAGPLINLAHYLAAMVAEQGRILLSGILHEQADTIIAAYQPWFHNFNVTRQNDWVRITATKIS